MKKIYSFLIVVLSLILLLPMLLIPASASSAYQTYTYSIGGKALYSPDAYSARDGGNMTSDNMGITAATGLPLNNPSDLITDEDGNCYIADMGNNRVIILNRYFEFQFAISEFINDRGTADALASPQGVFVFNDELWVCDTNKNRLVAFSKIDGSFIKIVDQPESQLFGDTSVYKPTAMAIDQYGRFYVVSPTTPEGIIVMTKDGEFVGFIGAQAVTISAWQILWRRFQTSAQKKLTASLISTEYNNITINENGFVYVTTNSIAESSVEGAIRSKTKSGKYLPVKLLNPAGEEIMSRNGFWPPAGEIDYDTENEDYNGVSKVTDVAVGPEKTWSIIDAKRNKIYTYDFNGNLLFAFGDDNTMLGGISKITAVCYQGNTMLVLNNAEPCSIIVYDRTGYGDMLISAIAAENSLDYDYAIQCWQDVLQRNSNFDAAYVGIGNALYRSGEYKESLKYFETAYDTTNWSASYKEVRKEWMAKWFLLVFILIIALIVGVVKWFAFAAKVNKRVATNGQVKKTFGQELIYGFYVLFHPFDGFYDLKHERRGSVRASLVFLAITVLTFFYQGIGQGYVLNPTHKTTTIMVQLISVLVPVFLFVLANWCLTTLFEGEGSFKDIFITTCYSLLPLPLFIIPATIASNWVSSTEASLIGFFGTLAFIWVGFLVFFGTMVTHDYPLFKNFITILGTIVAMAFIIFIVLLFSMLLSKLVSLVTNIITELQYRA